jgi:hypothetical protein
VSHGRTEAEEPAPWPRAVASAGFRQSPVIPGGGAGQGRRLERHSEMGDPFGGSGVEGCSPVSPSTTTLSGGGELAVVGQRSNWWRCQRGRGGVHRWSKGALDGEAASIGEEEGDLDR